MKLKRSAGQLIALTAVLALVGCSSPPASSTSPSGSTSGSGSTNVMGGPEATRQLRRDREPGSREPGPRGHHRRHGRGRDPGRRPAVRVHRRGHRRTAWCRHRPDQGDRCQARTGDPLQPGRVRGHPCRRLQAKRYDFSIASMGDTPEREKVVDFVDYSTDSNSIVTVKGNPKNITGMDSLCGLKISSVEGSVMLGLLRGAETRSATRRWTSPSSLTMPTRCCRCRPAERTPPCTRPGSRLT